jgi:enoyl-[acyl-carrier protein] reductase II
MPPHISADTLATRLTRQYGLRYPFASAGMGFVGDERLAAAVSNAGGLGMLGASPAPPESLAVMIERLRELTDGPWGVNLICAETALGPAATDEHVEVCLRFRVPLVVFHHDLPPAEWVRRLTSAGTRVWMQVPSLELAERAMEQGVEGLVAQGSEAGGHARATLGRTALLLEIRARLPDTLLLGAGGIADGKVAAASFRAGADGVWVGTRLVASAEAYAHPEYKARLVRSAGETVRTTAFGPEWPGQCYRLLATPMAAQHLVEPGKPVPDRPIGSTRLFPHSVNVAYDMPPFCSIPPTPDTSGDWDAMAYPAGQGVGSIDAVEPAGEIITRMMQEARAEL